VTTLDFTLELPLSQFTLELFVRVDDALGALPHLKKHPLAKLHPSEVVTLGLLYALRGGSFRAFYRWLRRELRALFPLLPERTRLYRILCAQHPLTQHFLASPTLWGIIDSFGIELLHPRRRCRTPKRWARCGYSNGRWIVGAKLAIVINIQGQVVSWQIAPAHVSDLEFLPLAHALEEQSVLLADQGFLWSHKPFKAKRQQAKGRRPASNIQVCTKGQRRERRLIETVFGLFTQVLHLKHLTQRCAQGVAMKLAFAMAAYNLCSRWWGTVNRHIAQFAL